jgi:curved DNA-binding protein CbpA
MTGTAGAKTGVAAAIAAFVDRAYANIQRLDYYRILGVGQDADSEAVRAAYYKLAAQLHPDLYGHGVDAEFRRKLTSVYSRVVEAYRVLTDHDRRRQYNQGLAEGKLRWDAGASLVTGKRSAADELKSEAARRFFKLGEEALQSGDRKAAVVNFRLALSMEPGSNVIVEHLARAEGKA